MSFLSLSSHICLLVVGAGRGQDMQGTLWLEQLLALAWPPFPGETQAELVHGGVDVFQETRLWQSLGAADISCGPVSERWA